MKKEDIHLGDWMRTFIGEVPGGFYIEVIIRTVFIFLLLILAMRLMGRRMAAQLSRNELIALVSLAAAIGVPLQAPDRGLLPAVIITIIIVLIARLIAKWSHNNQRFEKISQDNIDILVADAVLHIDTMKKSLISKDRLCAQLRSQGIRHLGEVKRLYIEANGSFTLVRADQPQPGLSVLPAWDDDFLKEQPTSEKKVCNHCGTPQNKIAPCPHCGSQDWVAAIN